MERKLAWGCVVLVLTQIQGYLPSLDFISQKELRLASFGLAVILTVAKGIEMFFEQVVKITAPEDKQIE